MSPLQRSCEHSKVVTGTISKRRERSTRLLAASSGTCRTMAQLFSQTSGSRGAPTRKACRSGFESRSSYRVTGRRSKAAASLLPQYEAPQVHPEGQADRAADRRARRRGREDYKVNHQLQRQKLVAAEKASCRSRPHEQSRK